MSADTDLPAADAEPEVSPEAAVEAPPAPWLVPVALLSAHPGNVREDLGLSEVFCASVAAAGVRVPLLVTPDREGYRVIEGHRRLAAAVKAGLDAVPCTLDAVPGDDLAGEFLDMAVANSDAYRRNFTALEEAAALFSAREAGATKTRIRRATGRPAAAVTAALAAGGLAEDTRRKAAGLRRPASLEDLALLAEFDGDEDATAQMLDALGRGYGIDYTAERIRQDRADAAAHAQLIADLQASGVTITESLPGGAELLSQLFHDGNTLTAEGHAQCPGRGAYFRSWDLKSPVWYCASPAEHGHVPKYAQQPPAPGGTTGSVTAGEPGPLPHPPADTDPDPDRRRVIEGNRAWVAAAGVRKRWLQGLLARRTAPREVIGFLAGQLLGMPQPLRATLATGARGPLLTQLAGHTAGELLNACATSPAGRLPLLMLAPVVTAYEHEICGEDLERRSTWREGRFTRCSRSEAGLYLAFLASIGYELSPIEQAVADGTPYTGDTPATAAPDGGDGDAARPGEDHDSPAGEEPDAQPEAA